MQDIINVAVFNKLFSSIAEEMGIILAKTSFSPNIKERRDFSCSLFDSQGRLVAQAAHIPVHLGAMPLTLEHVFKTTRLAPGDVVMVNDPFQGGTHLPDITLIKPVYHRNHPLFYVVNRAHHADVGGAFAGSMGLARTIDQEGVRIPPALLYRQGRLDKEFLDSFLSQVRTPSERWGDLQAQIASLNRGEVRLQEMVKRYGKSLLADIGEKLQDYAERLMENTIATLPPGTYHFSDALDDDGFGCKPLEISVALTVAGKKISFDFRESADQVASPVNTVESVTISAAIYVLQCLLGDGYPINQGSYRPLTVLTRPGSLLNALPPAPVAAGNVETSQRIVDVLLGALSQAIPERIPAACCGSMNNVAIGGHDRRHQRAYAYYETIAGGMGARPERNGLSGIHTHMTNTMNTPVEALEHAYPFQVEHYGLRRQSGGKGRFDGGEGIVRSYRFQEPAQVTLLMERQRLSPYGLAGGQPGKKGSATLVQGTRSQKLRGKTVRSVRAGDRLVIVTPGGGGWGHRNTP